mmetsp:Transcript_92922/g.206713  ORF Transcript_92922/g.206713 Transcript_92922/m.206713 type:complete len:193 (-) Transcript_92922:142-720(-)
MTLKTVVFLALIAKAVGEAPATCEAGEQGSCHEESKASSLVQSASMRQRLDVKVEEMPSFVPTPSPLYTTPSPTPSPTPPPTTTTTTTKGSKCPPCNGCLYILKKGEPQNCAQIGKKDCEEFGREHEPTWGPTCERMNVEPTCATCKGCLLWDVGISETWCNTDLDREYCGRTPKDNKPVWAPTCETLEGTD